MNGKVWCVIVLPLLASGLWVNNAYAGQIIKRNKCADFTETMPLEIYGNSTGSTRVMNFQIVRDGCRPKLMDGQYILRTVGSGLQSWTLTRLGKRTAGLGVSLQHLWKLQIYFSPVFSGGRVSGTFDYVLDVE